MSSVPTNSGLNFIGRYDMNRDGLSMQELQMGKMMSCMGLMQSMMTGNQQGMMAAMQDLQFATMAEQNFGTLAQATQAGPNPNNITPHDLMKTASNDGNGGDISKNDLNMQQQQNNMPPMMKMMMQMMQFFMQMIGQMFGQGQQQNQQQQQIPFFNGMA